MKSGLLLPLKVFCAYLDKDIGREEKGSLRSASIEDIRTDYIKAFVAVVYGFKVRVNRLSRSRLSPAWQAPRGGLIIISKRGLTVAEQYMSYDI
jgi:hypothetical protein